MGNTKHLMTNEPIDKKDVAGKRADDIAAQKTDIHLLQMITQRQ